MIKATISKEEMYQMYVVEKKNSKHIADILGCCAATAIKILRINNIPIRDIIIKANDNGVIINGKKTCIKCNTEKLIKEFTKRSKNKEKRKNTCKSCCTKIRKEWSQTDIGKNSNLKSRKKHYKTDKYIIKEKRYRKSKKGKVAIKRSQRKYFQTHKKETNKKLKEKRKIDPLFKLSVTARNSIRNAFKKNGFKKNSKTNQILGCTFEEFKIHIEKQFVFWMNWENYGKYNGEFDFGWDLDHKVPLSSAKSEIELIKLCHFSNIQPLCSRINRDIKKNKLNFILQ